MATMKVARIRQFGGPDVLQVENAERPECGRRDVLVRVHAASVNPVDYKTRSGSFRAVSQAQLPRILGRDVSGVVVAAGAAVQRFKVGDEIYALLELQQGGFAEYVAIDADLCATKPATLDYAAAASVPLAGLTAWQGLFEHGQLQSHQTVLIHGGAGGVGHFAIQFAKAKGARVATTVREADLDFVRSLGADIAIDYTSQRFEAQIQQIDLVLDLVGGEIQERSWSVLKLGGILVSTLGEPSRAKALQHNALGIGYLAEPSGGQLAEIARLIDQGAVRPVVQARFSLAQVRAAEEQVEKNHTRGKVVVDIFQPTPA